MTSRYCTTTDQCCMICHHDHPDPCKELKVAKQPAGVSSTSADGKVQHFHIPTMHLSTKTLVASVR